jgi:Domain of unknown function (DUF4333)
VRVRRIGAVTASLAVVLAGCGQNEIIAQRAAKTIADFVFMHTHFRPTDVKCPSGVPAKVGNTFDCHFTGPDGKYLAHVRIVSVSGTRVVQYIVTRRI